MLSPISPPISGSIYLAVSGEDLLRAVEQRMGALPAELRQLFVASRPPPLCGKGDLLTTALPWILRWETSMSAIRHVWTAPSRQGLFWYCGHVFAPWIAAFVARLRELGWIDGRTVPIEYQWSEGRTERYAEIAAQFVRQKVDVIVTIGSAVPTVRHATSVIPIVFAVAIDPVGAPQKSQPFEVAFGLMKSSIQREPLFGQPTPGIVPGPTLCHRCPGSRTPT